MDNTNTNNNDGWSTVGVNKIKKNIQKRKIKKQQVKLEMDREKSKQKHYKKYSQKSNWRQQRIALIKEKEIEQYKSRKITTEFAQAIQHERSIINMTREELALKIMIPESELALFENGKKCPTNRIVVEFRKVFENLPRKYFTLE